MLPKIFTQKSYIMDNLANNIWFDIAKYQQKTLLTIGCVIVLNIHYIIYINFCCLYIYLNIKRSSNVGGIDIREKPIYLSFVRSY
jgi:hypothetical protein